MKLSCLIIGIFLISGLEEFFYNQNVLQPSIKRYVINLKETILQMNHKNTWVYKINSSEYPLFPSIFEKFQYSFLVFFGALAIGITMACLLGIIVSMVKGKMKSVIYAVISILESIPDLFVVISFQIGVIAIYKKTGWLAMNILTMNEDKTYLLPILCLSILPTVHLFKMTLLLLEEEKSKQYVKTAKMKGLNQLQIIIKHIIPNVVISLFAHSKKTFAFMLSNLFILEYVFNMNGIMVLVLNSQGLSFVMATLFIVLPFYFIFLAGEFLLRKFNRKEGMQE